MATLAVHVVPRARRTEVSGWHVVAVEGIEADALARALLR
jgi:hypothetical protein